MTTPLSSSKLFLVADTRPADDRPDRMRLRRYRLARVRLEARSPEPAERYEHLRRVYD